MSHLHLPRFVVQISFALLALALASSARAEAGATEPATWAASGPENDVEVRLGAFLLSNVTTRLQLNSAQGQIGSNLDFAGALGGDTAVNVFRADANWAISGPHGVDASWFDIDLRGQRTLSADIAFGDEIYHVGATLESRFRTNVYKLAYSYTFHRDERHEFTGLIGAHIMNFQASIRAVNVGQLEQFSVTAPLPSFGLAWRARWTDRFNTRVSLQYFGISLNEDKYSGHFTDFLAAAEYRITSRWGVGAGYNRFDLNGNFRAGSYKLSAKYGYNGLLAYVFASF
jgi:hypothetical protein